MAETSEENTHAVNDEPTKRELFTMIQLAAQLRYYQKSYFQSKSKHLLNICFEKERLLDKMNEKFGFTFKPSNQTKIFNNGE